MGTDWTDEELAEIRERSNVRARTAAACAQQFVGLTLADAEDLAHRVDVILRWIDELPDGRYMVLHDNVGGRVTVFARAGVAHTAEADPW